MKHAFRYSKVTHQVEYIGPATYEEAHDDDHINVYTILRKQFSLDEKKAILTSLFTVPRQERYAFLGTLKDLRRYLYEHGESPVPTSSVVWFPNEYEGIYGVVFTLKQGKIAQVRFIESYHTLKDKLDARISFQFQKLHREIHASLPTSVQAKVLKKAFTEVSLSDPKLLKERYLSPTDSSLVQNKNQEYRVACQQLLSEGLSLDLKVRANARAEILALLGQSFYPGRRVSTVQVAFQKHIKVGVYFLDDLNEAPGLLEPPKEPIPVVMFFSKDRSQLDFLEWVYGLNSLFSSYVSDYGWHFDEDQLLQGMLPVEATQGFLIKLNQIAIRYNYENQLVAENTNTHNTIISSSTISSFVNWLPSFSDFQVRRSRSRLPEVPDELVPASVDHGKRDKP